MIAHNLVDSHIHLQDYDQETDLRSIVRQAREEDVNRLVCNGTEEADWHTVLALARDLPGVIPCLGLHPWFVTGRSPGWDTVLARLIAQYPCGVGEIGLDRLAKDAPREVQEECFGVQLDIAREYHRPVMVHCVRTWGRLMDLMKIHHPPEEGLLLHAYAGPAEMVRPLAEMGAYFSFSGKVLQSNHIRAREALLAVPTERLLIESDTPNMLPPPQFRMRTVTRPDGSEYNHPANLRPILIGIAHLLSVSPTDLAGKLWENARAFFGPIADF